MSTIVSRRVMPDPTLKRRPAHTGGVVNPAQSYLPFAPIAAAIVPPAQQPAAATLQQRNTQKRRAATAAASSIKKPDGFPMYLQDSDEPTIIHAGLKPRPASGPQVVVRPRIPLAVAAQQQAPSQMAWNGITAQDVTNATTNVAPKKLTVGLGIPQQQQRGTKGTLVPQRRRGGVVPPSAITPFAQRTAKPRVRPTLSTQLNHLTQQTEKLIDAINRGDVHSTIGGQQYAILSPNSNNQAASAAAVNHRPAGFFDPFDMMYANSPDHLISMSTKRFIVGKLTCKYPAMVHFKTDRVCYMFVHPYQNETQILMEMYYNDMTELRCTPAGGTGAFSFKIPHHLPAFDGYGDYEPQLRNHRLTIEFNSQTDMAKFKSQVYPFIQQQAIGKMMHR